MNEKPMEWMAVCGEGIGHKIGRFLSLLVAILAFLLFMMSGQFLIVLVAVAFGVLCAWLWMHAYVEYEFCHFDGDVDIAAIYNRARRKKKMSFKLEDVEYMVKKLEPQQTTKYFCKKNNLGGLYTLVVNQEGKRIAVVMEACPEFVKIMEMKRKVG